MPSFDVVSEVDKHELTNAVDQANRELGTRFDFKGVEARFELEDGKVINQSAPSDFQVKQMTDILRARLLARGIDVRCLEFGDMETNLAGARQKVTVKQGIEQKQAKQLVGQVEGSQAQGRSADQWRQAACQCQEARRPAGRDRAAEKGRFRAAAGSSTTSAIECAWVIATIGAALFMHAVQRDAPGWRMRPAGRLRGGCHRHVIALT